METKLKAAGNGALNAVNNALKQYTGKDYVLQEFTQHSLQGHGSQSVAAAYIGLLSKNNKMCYGVGTHTDIIKASTNALLSAFTNMLKEDN